MWFLIPAARYKQLESFRKNSNALLNPRRIEPKSKWGLDVMNFKKTLPKCFWCTVKVENLQR